MVIIEVGNGVHVRWEMVMILMSMWVSVGQPDEGCASNYQGGGVYCMLEIRFGSV